MQHVPKLKTTFLFLRNSIASSYHCHASFHSTPASLAKWKDKWKSDAGSVPKPTKSYIRYTVRQKRSDAKKALKDLIYESNCSRLSFEDVGPIWDSEQTSSSEADEADNSDSSNKKSRAKKPRRSSRPGKGKSRRRRFTADSDEDSYTSFEATYGNRCYTWSSRLWEEPSFRSSSAGFEWRNQSKPTRNKKRVWDSTSETDDYNEESCIVGSYSDRTILGLPPKGPLKIADVKSAFRSSALKWHPDKHQGHSQWLVALGKALTIDNLKRKGMTMVNRCYLCKGEEESCVHLFRDCSFFHNIWVSLTASVNGRIGVEGSVMDVIRDRSCNALSPVGKLLWDSLVHAIWWCIWEERNKRAFENKEREWMQVRNDIISLLWQWLRFEDKMAGIFKDNLICNWTSFL